MQPSNLLVALQHITCSLPFTGSLWTGYDALKVSCTHAAQRGSMTSLHQLAAAQHTATHRCYAEIGLYSSCTAHPYFHLLNFVVQLGQECIKIRGHENGQLLHSEEVVPEDSPIPLWPSLPYIRAAAHHIPSAGFLINQGPYSYRWRSLFCHSPASLPSWP